LFVNKARKRWPDATVYVAPGLERKRPDMAIDGILGDRPPEAWADQFDQFPVEGAPKLGEVVFYHKPSRSLIVTDLLFNIRKPKGWQATLMMTLAGVRGRFAQSRLVRLATKDRKRAGDVCRNILACDFERVIMTHGEVVTENARTRAEQGLQWMLRR